MTMQLLFERLVRAIARQGLATNPWLYYCWLAIMQRRGLAPKGGA